MAPAVIGPLARPRLPRGTSDLGGRRAHSTISRQIVAVLGPFEAVLPAVDELLDREQRDQHAGRRNDRRCRRSAGSATASGSCRGRASRSSSRTRSSSSDTTSTITRLAISMRAARRAGHPLGDLGQVEVVVAARRRRHADEHAPGEERRRDLLQPQPGRAERARDDVAEHRQREHEDADAAQDHQHGLEPVERLPLQVAVALQDQRAEIGHWQ